MAERKVLTKYYPPDFDPSKIDKRSRRKTPGPKIQDVRLMAPFAMKCTSCGEFIYKGRKFNARKETTDEKYYAITIFRLYIKCTRCSAQITFKTDPKNMDYVCERGAKRNFEPWREDKLKQQETDEERLDRVAREEEERDAMKELEKKTLDAKTEMQIADALDDIRHRNAARSRAEKDGVSTMAPPPKDDEMERIERDLEEQARAAFKSSTGERVRRLAEDLDGEKEEEEVSATTQSLSKPKEKKSLGILGLKKKGDVDTTPTPAAASRLVVHPPAAPPLTAPPPAPSSLGLVDYDSDSD